ncbi:MAG: 30S ribosomal protein S17P [Candidatus Heimdallarchaeota archaeon LC_3]|uniref:Putative 30S ribosomal protein S17P n=1 Tax=uncultured organism TaxID=155900 RepID=A0A0F6PX61_9ZZZZ|nr:putative 30S ribosomal protein S17P [uncultured organism]OLS22809.1 MAG: 30S ribosomal protein S17P [Candidatus Heimdallarchaeota archaeon LC_3]
MSKTNPRGRDIGFAPAPKSTCSDVHCPFHGNLSIRGKTLTGTVVSDKNHYSVTIQRSMLVLDKKYNRYLRKTSKVSAYNPPCIDARVGQRIKIGECRKIAKTIAFCVIEVLEEAKE